MGVRERFDVTSNTGKIISKIGGGFIEPLGYDSRAPRGDLQQDEVKITLDRKINRFSLCDLLGATSAAPQEKLESSWVLNLMWHIFPHYYHWSPVVEEGKVYPETHFAHTDGGILENLGIMPLLARKVKNIIVFVNSPTPFKYNEDPSKCEVADSIRPLFYPGVKSRPDAPTHKNEEPQFKTNIVFEESKLVPLLKAWYSCQRNNKPLVHNDEYIVLDNTYYGITKYSAKISWVYLARVGSWESALNNEDKEKLKKITIFPNYSTFINDQFVGLDLHESQLLADFCEWIITLEGSSIDNYFDTMNSKL